MTTEKQKAAAKQNIQKAQKAAKEKQTLKHLPKETKTALAKQANKVKQEKEKAKK